MTDQEWQPGDRAVATVRGTAEVEVIRTDDPDMPWHSEAGVPDYFGPQTEHAERMVRDIVRINDEQEQPEVWGVETGACLLVCESKAQARALVSRDPHETGTVARIYPCVHCGEYVAPRRGDWTHAHGKSRCQSDNVTYGHLAHPAHVPCRAGGPNPCLGASRVANLASRRPCLTCSPPSRETVNMVCQACGWDYAKGEKL